MSRVRTTTMRVVHEHDPATIIMEGLKALLPEVQCTGHDALICMYERSRKKRRGDTKTKGGIIVPDTADVTSEDAIQGNVGLIVKLGPNVRANAAPQLGFMPEVGDWVVFAQRDALPLILGDGSEDGDFSMRVLEAQMIRLRVLDPTKVM